MDTDKSNMIDVLRDYPNMIEKASSLGDDCTVPKEFVDTIVIAGMGGSGFTGDILKTYLSDLPIQVHVIKDYVLPSFVNRKTLIFAISYSGNTEETVTAYRSALRRNCKIIVISSGGKLEELSKLNQTPFIKVPGGIQPRLSTPYLLTPILNVLSYSGIIPDQEKIIKKCYMGLKSASSKIEENAKELASKLNGKLPIIYASTRMFCLAEKWKTDINENAKAHAFFNVFPEFNHNEICAYENKTNEHVVIINDSDDHEKVKLRIKIFKKLLAKYKVPVNEIALIGENLLSRIMFAIWMGLFASYYLALSYGRDPTPVKIIEQLKKELA